MKATVGSRSAASRKAWRTRKRMAAARVVEARSVPERTGKDLWPAYMRRALPVPAFGSQL